MVLKASVVEVPPCTWGVFHLLSLPKEDWRLEADFKPQTSPHQILKNRFRTETVSKVIASLGPMASSHRLNRHILSCSNTSLLPRVLRFAVDSKVNQYHAMPFGITIAPHIFTTVLTPLAEFLHTLDIMMFPYINNLLQATESCKDALAK